MELIGRKNELAILKDAILDDRSHFIAVYGRRRIGKTFLIREAFNHRFTFQHAGLSDGTLSEQLTAFNNSIQEAGYMIDHRPQNWMDALNQLKEVINNSPEKKKVIFIDELSWMDTPKSRLIVALEHFWNGWASARNDVILIVCSSATSWMLSNIIHNKSGLYNRLTEQIHLKPFQLSECEEYVKSKDIAFTRDQILRYYMIFGGVPYYWTFIKKGKSLEQNVDSILFANDAPLQDEFKYLYASIFRNPTAHIKLISTLGKKKAGMTREELIKGSGLSNSGDLTAKLEELESCGFIRKYRAFGMKNKNAVYQLIDNFTLFYYKFMENRPTDEHFWSSQINTPAVNTWNGLAFERVCLLHTEKIKEKLGISGVHTDINSWYCAANPDIGILGSQIDLLIVRADQVINLCEMKYSSSEYAITDKVDKSIKRKIHDLITVTKTKYAVYPTLITCHGIIDNAYSNDIQAVITVDDLFKA
ncbi:MAG: ATP-binding protein [Eubacterium sp.]|nr:ATP-binding protein [Eubacterium sp.]